MEGQGLIGYSKNDYFYIRAKESGFMPSDKDCNVIMHNDEGFDYETICNIDNEVNKERFDKEDNAIKCINRELCMNKEKATILNKMKNQNSGSYGNYEDTTDRVEHTLLNTINLGVGIGLLGYLIYRNSTNVFS